LLWFDFLIIVRCGSIHRKFCVFCRFSDVNCFSIMQGMNSIKCLLTRGRLLCYKVLRSTQRLRDLLISIHA
jgi:hypothetical protein